MIEVDPQFIDGVRSVQAMFLGTMAGKLLLAGIMDRGHVNEKIQNEQERVECNFAHDILASAGIELVPQAADLREVEAHEGNVTDEILGQGEPNE